MHTLNKLHGFGESVSYPATARTGWLGVVSSQPLAEMVIDEHKNLVVSTKNRYLSFGVGDPLENQSIRVKFVDLAPPYDQFNDDYMWVGEPFKVTESPAQTTPGQPGFADFWVAKLQCDKPVPMDFTTLTGDCVGRCQRRVQP